MSTDLKVYLTNAGAFTASFTNIDETLKLILLVVSISYTIQRWYLMNKNK